MARKRWTSSDALSNIEHVQDFLNSSHVGAPRVWSLSGVTPSLPTARVCELGRCLSGPGSLAPPNRRYNGTTCPASASDCAPLAHDEWLANADFWTKNASKVGELIFSTQATVLKKSTDMSDMLPPSQLLRVQAGFPCRLLAPKTWAGYWLCRHRGKNTTIAKPPSPVSELQVRTHATYCDVNDFGAVPDDGLSDTDAIQAALVACGGPDGGKISLNGLGVYESAPMNLTSNQILYVGTGTILQAPVVNESGHCHDNRAPCPYPVMDHFPSYQMSRSGFGCRLGPFIGAFHQHNITITGGGTIEGNGQWFWEPAQMKSLKIERPRLVELQFVHRLRIGPIVLRNSPYWTLHPIYCDDVHIHDIEITADDGKGGWGFNTDGTISRHKYFDRNLD
jgi:hypothetical protein